MVVDLVHYLKERVEGWKDPMVVFYDGIHVNDHGSKLYAAYIVEALAPLMRALERKQEALRDSVRAR